MADAPKTPATPRPNDEPYYINTDCPECGEALVLVDELQNNDGEIWHDEWMCPDCRDGTHLDVPGMTDDN